MFSVFSAVWDRENILIEIDDGSCFQLSIGRPSDLLLLFSA